MKLKYAMRPDHDEENAVVLTDEEGRPVGFLLRAPALGRAWSPEELAKKICAGDDVYAALVGLAKWATGPQKDGNPYTMGPVKKALQAIARRRGLPEKKWWDALDDLPQVEG